MRDYRDDVITELAASEGALIDQVATLKAERNAFRTLAAICTHYNIQLWRQIQMLDRGSDVSRLHADLLRSAVDAVVAEQAAA